MRSDPKAGGRPKMEMREMMRMDNSGKSLFSCQILAGIWGDFQEEPGEGRRFSCVRHRP